MNRPVEARALVAEARKAGDAAVKLAPSDSFANVAPAMSLWNVGQRDAAIARARLAVTLADNEGSRRRAQQMLDFFVKNATAPRWTPAGDTSSRRALSSPHRSRRGARSRT